MPEKGGEKAQACAIASSQQLSRECTISAVLPRRIILDSADTVTVRLREDKRPLHSEARLFSTRIMQGNGFEESSFWAASISISQRQIKPYSPERRYEGELQ